MLAIGVADGDDDTALWGRLWRFDALAMLGRLDEAEAELPLMRVIAERVRRPIARWHYLRDKAAIDIARGRFDDAIKALDKSLAVVGGRAAEHVSLAGQPITVLTIVGGLTGRTDITTEQMLEVFHRLPPSFINVVRAANHVRLGDREGARRLFAGAPSPDGVPATSLLIGCAAYVEVAAALGSSEYLAAAEKALRAHADAFVTGGAGAQVIAGSVRGYLGIAAAAAGRLDEAVRELRFAIDANDRAGTPPFAALARFELAKVLARRRRPTDAEEAGALAAAVAHTAETLRMAPLRREAAALSAALRGDAPEVLTRREREVAAHVAQGLTNKQIAAMMHISERTAEKHVAHILEKLSLPNRTGVAAWARQGMRTEPS
jgi:DNA-binding NarL/FixJ family response regulator